MRKRTPTLSNRAGPSRRFTYRSIEPALFGRIVSAGLQTKDNACVGDPKCVRVAKMSLPGKLSWSAIPIQEPIIMGTVTCLAFMIFVTLAWIT